MDKELVRQRLGEEEEEGERKVSVSTGKLSGLLHLHARPIDLVVFKEPSHLRAGDQLRCSQSTCAS
jgi:hypothetical protein